ncbi:hypothetical protein ACS0TY_006662 [Phlomoides rotata]
MATSALKSTSRRGTAAESKAPPPTAASRRRSHSVSAVSRKTHLPFDDNATVFTEFSNSRDNPLFWATSSPPDKEENGKPSGVAISNSKLSNSVNSRNTINGNGGGSSTEHRGRSVTRSSSEKKGIGRSLSRIRGQSVSRAPYSGAYESEKEQAVVASTVAQSRNEFKRIGNSIRRTNSVRNKVDKPRHAKNAGVRMAQNQATEWSEDDSACSLQISNLEDGFSIGSLSEAEDKTRIAAFEELNVFRRNNTYVGDIPSDLVNPEAGELVMREYAIKLEESEERARKLRADLAVEEHRGQELDRILKEILPDPETSATQRPRRGRRTSNERKRMSRRLTEEAMTYFDECVSLSTFDSSDFSASEDPLYGSVRANGSGGPSSLVKESPSTLCCNDQGSPLDQQQIFGDFMQLLDGCADSGPTANSSSAVPGSTQPVQFSFSHKGFESTGPQENIRSYIKNFERGAQKDVDLEATSSYYDSGEYSTRDYTESLLIERVLYKSKMESGRLLLCGGAITCLSFV